MLSSVYYPLYTINFPKYWFVRDEPKDKLYSPVGEDKSGRESLLFHVSAGDYLSTLATVLRFFEEAIRDEKIPRELRELELKTMKSVIDELLYLEKNYDITPKDKKSV